MEIDRTQNGAPKAKPEPKYRGVKAMPFVIGNETFEKLGTVGTSANLLIYLTTVFHMSSISAINVLNIFNGTCNFGTLIGGYLSDTYFGRYNVLGFGSICSFIGMLILTLTAAVSGLHPPECSSGAASCTKATQGQIGFLLTGFGFLIIGASGIRPCALAFGADQFNPKTESGKRGISSFFNWYYLTFTFAMMVSLTVIVYVQSEKSWPIGLAIPTSLMFLSCVFFFIGTRLYVRVRPEGSPFVGVAQVVVAAVKKRKLKLPENPEASRFHHFSGQGAVNARLQFTDQFRFLNKAAIITTKDATNEDGSATHPWRLSTVQNVEEVKCLLRIIPILVAIIFYFIPIIQSQNYIVFQALQSDRRIGTGKFKIPAASYNLFSMLTVTLTVPVFDRLLVPLLRKRTGNPGGMTLLQRMGIGIGISILAMVVSAVVETNRRHIALSKPTLGIEPRKGAISSMSGYWLVPQMILAGFTELFTIIGMNEFFYQQSPENMRTMGVAFIYVGLALSSYLSSFMSSLVQSITASNGSSSSSRGSRGWLAEDLNEARLDNFYYLLALLAFLNCVFFLVCAKWYKYKEIIVVGDDAISSEVAMDKRRHLEKSVV